MDFERDFFSNYELTGCAVRDWESVVALSKHVCYALYIITACNYILFKLSVLQKSQLTIKPSLPANRMVMYPLIASQRIAQYNSSSPYQDEEMKPNQRRRSRHQGHLVTIKDGTHAGKIIIQPVGRIIEIYQIINVGAVVVVVETLVEVTRAMPNPRERHHQRKAG